MAKIAEAMSVAIQHHQAGRFQQAEAIYRQILAADPNHADAWHLLGMLTFQSGRHRHAVEYVEQAIRLDGTVAAFHNTLGEAYRAGQRLDEAGAQFQRAIHLKPELAEAHNNLGIVRKEQNDLETAVACFERALQLKPEFAAAHNNLGTVYLEQKQWNAAVACYTRALQLQPDYADARRNLHVVERQISLEAAEAHYNLGVAWKEQGRLDKARDCYESALALKPDFVEALGNLGIVWKELGRVDDAINCYQRALEIRPHYIEATVNLATAQRNQGRLDDAIAGYQRALQLMPDSVDGHYGMGNVWTQKGRFEEAIGCYRRVLQLVPDHTLALVGLVNGMQHLCQWAELDGLARRIIDVVDQSSDGQKSDVVSPFAFLSLPTETTAQQQLHCAQRYASRLLRNGITRSSRLPKESNGPGASSPPSKIKIGYLSADFRSHAVADLIVELFERHDRRRFSVFGYSIGPDDGGPLRKRVVGACDKFVEMTSLSFTDSARQIAADDVDILVDLTGYTMHCRPQILAQRPAPIQVQYLGYPGTMGATFIDYALVDDFVVPRDQQACFTEKLVHLPGCYQVNPSHRDTALHVPSRQECGLPDNGTVFCCFNNSYKITPDVFDIWMCLLKNVPGSVLWLLEGNPSVAPNLRREAEARGVSAERLIFAPRLPLAEYISRHRVADLFLDTFPYNAHATASYALWAGCPVLTLAGATFASRVAGSLLRTLGLTELITFNLEDYFRVAHSLARNPDQLRGLRTRLEVMRTTSPLFDTAQFALNIESAYATMWRIHSAGEAPRPFAVSAT